MPTILVTGASSGIGAALARCYAGAGTTLLLWGRDADRLEAVALECRTRGAAVTTVLQDLSDIEGSMNRLRELDLAFPIDLAIFNAGVGGLDASDPSTEPAARALTIATVNFGATATLATLMAELMTPRRSGRIAIIGSVAQFFPLPMAPTYSGSKAGIAVFAEALALRVEPHGISVTLISPGFVDTPMSQQLGKPRPFLIGPDQAAIATRRIIDGRKRHAVIPSSMAVFCAVARHAPRLLMHAVLRRL